MWALHVSRIIYILHVLFATRMHGVSICIPLFCYAFMLRPWVYCVSRQNEHCSLLWATCTGAGGWQSDGKYKCQHPLLLRLRVCCFARWSCCFSVAHTSTINCISNMPFEFNMSPRIIILVSVCVMYTRVRRLPPPLTSTLIPSSTHTLRPDHALWKKLLACTVEFRWVECGW